MNSPRRGDFRSPALAVTRPLLTEPFDGPDARAQVALPLSELVLEAGKEIVLLRAEIGVTERGAMASQRLLVAM